MILPIALLLLAPFCSLAAFTLRNDARRHALLAACAAMHFVLTLSTWITSTPPLLSGWIALDPPGRLILNLVSFLFLAVALYSIAYLRREKHGLRRDAEEGILFVNAPEAIFSGCILAVLGAMTLICFSQHFGLLWVGLEATTVATAPLIYYHRHHRSLEATWKYLLICSVGIAIALLGNFFLAAAASGEGGQHIPLLLGELTRQAGGLNSIWLKASFLFLLIGYGTKMGLAPMHTWKPDAYSEAPATVAALLSGAVTSCAFLGLLRIHQVCSAAGLEDFTRGPLVLLGFLSIAVAGVFLIAQEDYKRMLAYSSVEHMGVLAFALGLGEGALFGALLHLVNNALVKPLLFFAAGNIRHVFKTKAPSQVRGVVRILPVTGFLWITGILASAGFPPFGLFLSEFIILRAALNQGHPWMASAFLVFLTVCFLGISATAMRMALGDPPDAFKDFPVQKEKWTAIIPPFLLFAPLLLFGLYLPPFFHRLLRDAAAAVGGGP